MAKLSSDMRKAFECLGVSPDADAKIIRAAWKKLVRAYHPDLYKNNQAEGNRRLAELNAAFDLISSWSTEEANAANQAARARQAERMHRTAAQQRAAAERAAAERKKQAEADARVLKQQRQAAAARKRAVELDREDALRRARKASERRCASPSSPHHRFMSALSQLAARPANRFSFSM